MHLPRSSPLLRGLVPALALCAGIGALAEQTEKKSAPAAKPPPPREPERRELWVPSDALEEVLRRQPDAVLLTPQEYEALVRDAGRIQSDSLDPAEKPPVELAIESLRLKGRVDAGATEVQLHGELAVNVPAEGWSETRVLWNLDLTSVTSDGDVLLSQRPKSSPRDSNAILSVSTGPQLFIHARGPGRRVVRFQTTVPVQFDPRTGDRSLEVGEIGCTGTLEMEFPPNAKVRSSFPHETAGTARRFLLQTRTIGTRTQRTPPEGGVMLEATTALAASARVIWTEAADSTAAVRWNPKGESAHQIDESFLRSTTKLRGSLTGGAMQETVRVPLVPSASGVRVEEVRSPALEGWTQTGDTLELTLRRVGADFPVEIDLSRALEADASGSVIEVALPGLDLGGAVAISATVDFAEGLEALSATGVRGADFSTMRKGGFRHAAGSTPPVITLRAALPRIEADVDTRIRLEKDSVLLSRTVALRTDRPFRSVKLELPDGEELSEVVSQQGPGLDWKRVDRTLEVRFSGPVTNDAPATLTVASRKKLARAWSGAGVPEEVSIVNLGVPDAVKVAGYAALDFDDAWKVSLGAIRGLEDRDARFTPVTGRMAWFGLRDWELPFTVERGASVYSAELTAYALPRSRTIEIEGQVMLDISGAPLRSFRAQVPAGVAKLLRWTSREIGEQQLDEETGIWTCTLIQETVGRPVLRFRLSLPANVTDADATSQSNGSTRLEADLPHFAMPDARRFQGTWVVEANTDTELSLTAKSMQPLDVLRVPAVQDYQPRHRIVAAYRFGAGDNELSLKARRHAHAEMAALVILNQTMRSVLGTDGAAFHEARIALRHSGEQFVALHLPDDALLLSTTVDATAVKPVRGPDGSVAIPLPGDSANAAETGITVQYRLAGKPWSGRGRLTLEPPQPLGNIPVLQTRWEIHVPEGWRYSTGKTTLHQDSPDEPVALLSILASPFAPPVFGKQMEMTADEPSDSAADHQRARMLNGVDGAWEDRVPESKPMFPDLGDDSLPRSLSEGRYLTSKPDQIIIPRIQFQNVSLEEAIEFLRVQSRKLDEFEPNPAKKGVNFILKTGDTPVDAKISLDLKDVPLIEALRYITELAGMKYRIESFAIVISPITDVATEQYTRIYKVPPDFLSMGTEANQAPAAASDPFASASASPTTGLIQRQTAKEIFQAQGIPFPEGSSAIYNPVTSELIVRNTQSNLDLVEAFSNSLSAHAGPSGPPPIIPEQFRLSELKGPDPETELLREKLNSIILPTVNFSGATLEEAIEYIRVKGRDTYDGSAGISIRLGESLPPSTPTISVELRDVPVAEALRYITELAGLKYVIRDGEILIVPLSDVAASIEERAYALPPNAFPSGQPPKEVLMNQGIPFPEGSSADVQPDGRTLVVRNTPPNLELVEAYLAAIWNQSKDTPPYSRESLGLDRPLPTAVTLLPALGVSDPFGLKEGLIPLEVELPQAGRTLVFSGHQNPEAIELRFASWERLLAEACGWMLLGAGLFVRRGRRHPVRKSLLAVAVLAGAIPYWLPGWIIAANALLFGWLVALAVWIAWRVAQRCARCCPTESETPQPGGEHATV